MLARNYVRAGESGKQTIGRGAENPSPRRSSFRGQRVGAVSGGADSLEHDPEKWTPVFRKDHAPTKKLDHDPIQLNRIMV
jgi:hypothetical protein